MLKYLAKLPVVAVRRPMAPPGQGEKARAGSPWEWKTNGRCPATMSNTETSADSYPGNRH